MTYSNYDFRYTAGMGARESSQRSTSKLPPLRMLPPSPRLWRIGWRTGRRRPQSCRMGILGHRPSGRGRGRARAAKGAPNVHRYSPMFTEIHRYSPNLNLFGKNKKWASRAGGSEVRAGRARTGGCSEDPQSSGQQGSSGFVRLRQTIEFLSPMPDGQSRTDGKACAKVEAAGSGRPVAGEAAAAGRTTAGHPVDRWDTDEKACAMVDAARSGGLVAGAAAAAGLRHSRAPVGGGRS